MIIPRLRRPHGTTAVLTAAIATGALLLATGCAPTQAGRTRPTAATSLYPLQYITERIGAGSFSVTNVVPRGGEPHDLELAPATIRKLHAADVVIHLPGFQPALDAAINPTKALDITAAARLEPLIDHDHDHDHGHDEHHREAFDPHFWLDPSRLAEVADLIGHELAQLDATNAAQYQHRTKELKEDLHQLDTDFENGLETCEQRTIVTTHAAFGYLTAKYDLREIPISGLNPEAEPAPAQLRRVSQRIAEQGITTVFHESTSNAKTADVLAADLGIDSAVLDPLETQTDPGADYLDVMNTNLATLRSALKCH